MHLVLCISFYTTTYVGFVTEVMTASHPIALDQCRLLKKRDLLDFFCLKLQNF